MFETIIKLDNAAINKGICEKTFLDFFMVISSPSNLPVERVWEKWVKFQFARSSQSNFPCNFKIKVINIANRETIH